jgi:hypothetical protein
MPRYFFVLHGPDGEQHDDAHGTDFADSSGARAYAERIIRELKNAGGYDDPDWIMVIRDRNGEEIATLPFSNPD